MDQQKEKMVSEAIDAVVTWVDGSDPKHRKKRERALNDSGKAVAAASKESIRFSDNGEIRWCLYSIRKHMPWVRNIYLVTDDQEPDFLTQAVKDELGVTVIDHKIIFRGYEEYLPCFNPYAIESLLWRIPGLSDRFVYLNDDFVVIQPAGVDDFFRGESLVLRGEWERVRSRSQISLKLNSIANFALKRFWGVSRTMQLYSQMNGAELGGFTDRYYRSPHVPHPFRRNVFESYFRGNPRSLEMNLLSRFRRVEDFVPGSVADHIEIKAGDVVLESSREGGMISGEALMGVDLGVFFDRIRSGHQKFFCIQSFARFSVSNQKRIREAINDRLQLPNT